MEGSLSPLRDYGKARRGWVRFGAAWHGAVWNHRLADIRVQVPDGEMPFGVWVWHGKAGRG